MAKEKDLQKIQQASGVTSDTTVRMVDASGNSVQIDRDVFMQAIRDVLPSVLSDQGTNATKVSTLNSSNVLGTSTIANLASVLGVPVLPQNTCTATEISSSSYYTQKVACSLNRGSGIILFANNGGGEGIIEFTYNSSKTMQAKLIINRSNSDSYIPSLYYDGDKTIAVVAKENWGKWTLISNNDVPPKGTVDSDLTGFTQVAIQNTPALDYGSLGDLASALGGVNNNIILRKSQTFSYHKYRIAHLASYNSMALFLRYGNCTSQMQNMAIFSINSRDSVTYTQTLAKASSPEIYINTVAGSHTDVYVDAGSTYPVVEVASFVPYSSSYCVLLEPTDVDFSQLQKVSL